MKSSKESSQVIPDPPDPIDWKEAARLYCEAGLSYAEIARRTGRHRQAIRTSLLTHGVPRHRTSARGSGKWGERLYGIWKGMKHKCRRPGTKSYKHYGAHGIDFCAEWEKFQSFYQWAMGAGYKRGMSLALDDWAKVFSPLSCRWVTPTEKVQCRLRLAPPRPRRLLTAFRETKGVAAWARDPRCKVGIMALCRRLDGGYSPEDALTLPGNMTQNPANRKLIERGRRRPSKRRGRLIDWNEVARLHREEGFSPPKIARVLGVSSSAVWIGLKRKKLYQTRERNPSSSELGKPLHAIWRGMLARCADPRRPAYMYYGAKGIRVSKEWSAFEPFYHWALKSGYRRGLCITRADCNADYSPTNCAWVTRAKAAQGANHPPRPSKARWTVRAFGETKGPTAWSNDARCQVTLTSLLRRLRSRMEPEEAISMPPQKPGGKQPRRLITALGMTKSLTNWSRDRRCRVSTATIVYRLKCDIAPDAAITTPPFKLHVGEAPRKREKSHRAKRKRERNQ